MTSSPTMMSDLEQRADVASLEALHNARRELIEQNARLIGLYGPFGHYDDHRKHMVEALKIQARMTLRQQGEKTTEAMIDANAYGSEQYAAFIDNALGEKIEYVNVANRITELDELIRDREMRLRAYTVEAGLR
jgi:hypothetical protein